MKLNNKGFALTSIIYMLIVLFLLTMLLVLANLATRKVVLDKIKNDVKYNLNQGGLVAQNIYIVTFDPTLGQIDQTSKQVKYNEPYGELPTPTREGYTFKGWRGKNAFNPQDFYNIGKNYGVELENNSIILSQYPYQENYTKMNLVLKNNTQYTLSYNWLVTQITQGERIKSGLNIGCDDGTTAVSNGLVAVGGALDASGFKTLTSGESKNLSFVRSAGWQWSGTMKLSNIQLEEGTEATQYEPYQEYTSDTIVTRQENHTLYAMWEKKESTFITGPEFNAKIKQLAGNDGATNDTNDTNITSIERANALPNFELNDNNIVSTNDSNTPTYVWFDNGTVYYYTEALNLYMNPDSRYMFNKLTSARKIEVSMIDTSKVRDMRFLFQDCSSLQSLNLTNFNVEKVTLMSHMFYNCSSLTELDLSSFNTTHGTGNMFANCTNLRSINFGEHFDVSGGTSTRNMFYRCSSLTKLDLSTFNMESITDTAGMLSGTTSLTELKTPKVYPSAANVSFGLPKTMYDASNNAYTTLGSGSPTETLLKDTQTN